MKLNGNPQWMLSPSTLQRQVCATNSLCLSHSLFMIMALIVARGAGVQVRFDTCDICEETNAAVNLSLSASLQDTNLFLFTFICAENASAMQQGGHIFLTQLFAKARPGAVLLFTDTTHRMWPEISALGGDSFLSFVLLLNSSSPKHALMMVKRCNSHRLGLDRVAVSISSKNAQGEKCLFISEGDPEVVSFLEKASEHQRKNHTGYKC